MKCSWKVSQVHAGDKIGFSKPILSPLWTWENFPLTLHISFLTAQRENIKNIVLFQHWIVTAITGEDGSKYTLTLSLSINEHVHHVQGHSINIFIMKLKEKAKKMKKAFCFNICCCHSLKKFVHILFEYCPHRAAVRPLTGRVRNVEKSGGPQKKVIFLVYVP